MVLSEWSLTQHGLGMFLLTAQRNYQLLDMWAALVLLGGIGYLLNLAQQHSKPEWSLAGIAVVGVIGLVTDFCIAVANKMLFRWRETATA